jgi:hypothetical protein
VLVAVALASMWQSSEELARVGRKGRQRWSAKRRSGTTGGGWLGGHWLGGPSHAALHWRLRLKDRQRRVPGHGNHQANHPDRTMPEQRPASPSDGAGVLANLPVARHAMRYPAEKMQLAVHHIDDYDDHRGDHHDMETRCLHRGILLDLDSAKSKLSNLALPLCAPRGASKQTVG